MELSCSVCSELYVPSEHVVITQCGHLFHHACIVRWLQRSQTCPECRAECTATRLIKVHFNVTAHNERNRPANAERSLMEDKIDILTSKVTEQEQALKQMQESTYQGVADQVASRETLMTLLEEVRLQNTVIQDLGNKTDECTVGLADFLANMFDSS
uniref:RING-type domain-containing protein n=1 Tax=Anopheles epiroticus TaxID=199890 RepID=A0A182PER2_9DIPT